MPIWAWKWIAMAVLAGWASYATYQWISISSTAPLICDKSVLEGQVNQLTADLAAQKEETLAADERVKAGDKAMAQVAKTFSNIKGQLGEIYIDTCTGTFPARVQNGLNQAVEAANSRGELPPAGN